MAINFPISPALNDLYTFTGKTWKWNGFAWDVVDPLTVGLGGSGHLEFSTISTDGFSFLTNSTFKQLEIAHTASAVNYPSITGSITGSPVVIQAKGSDTNIGINLVTKGTGTVTINGSPITSGNVNGPASSTNNNIAVFDGTTGKLLKDGTKAIADFALLAGATFTGNVNVPSLNTGPLSGFRNRVINGDFSVWQRGTSFSGAVSTFTADRWIAPGAAGQAITRVADHPIVGANGFCIQVANTGGTEWIYQRIESANCRDLAGQTVTVSCWVKITALGGTGVQLQLQRANSVDNFAAVTDIGSSSILSTTGSWIKLSFTVALPSTAANGIQVRIITSGGGGGAATVRLSNCQLEIGSSSTPFEFRSYGMELFLCQRYYSRWTPTAAAQIAGTGYISGTTVAQIFIPMPVEMRIPVASVETSGTAADYYVLHQNTTATSTVVPGISSSGTKSVRLQMTTAAVLTVGQGAMLYAANTNAFIGFSAEL